MALLLLLQSWSDWAPLVFVRDSKYGMPVVQSFHLMGSNDLVMMTADVETTSAFRVGTPKMLFRVAGPIASSLGGVSRDGQRFVLPVNVPADKTAQSSGAQ